MTSTAGSGEPVCYLDYDGCLHHCNVRWSKQRGLFLEAPGRYSLFQHVRILEELLAPYPAVRVVLSTSWAQKLGLKAAVHYLPESLQRRVIGATYEVAQGDDFFPYLNRGEQVLLDVQRRGPSAWLALDDDQIGWPTWTQARVVFTDPYEGLAPPEVQGAIREKLRALAVANGAHRGHHPEQSCSSGSSHGPVAIRERQGRRLALHEAAVRLLRDQPSLSENVQGVLDRWRSRGVQDSSVLVEWQRILDSEDWDALLEAGEHGDEVRKGSPFTFVVGEDERLTIFRQFAAKGP